MPKNYINFNIVVRKIERHAKNNYTSYNIVVRKIERHTEKLHML